MEALIGIAIGYGVVAVVHGLIMLSMFAMEVGDRPDPDEARKYATWLLATPFWPYLYIKGLVGLLASAKHAVMDGEKEEK